MDCHCSRRWRGYSPATFDGHLDTERWLPTTERLWPPFVATTAICNWPTDKWTFSTYIRSQLALKSGWRRLNLIWWQCANSGILPSRHISPLPLLLKATRMSEHLHINLLLQVLAYKWLPYHLFGVILPWHQCYRRKLQQILVGLGLGPTYPRDPRTVLIGTRFQER